ncbi:MAG: efflux RND transporter periplasmic adaptor subunit [Myxococcales bacterium]|nr:efflux RND transporter periplasmic adaptor subunit [Myxococcales bacterium]
MRLGTRALRTSSLWPLALPLVATLALGALGACKSEKAADAVAEKKQAGDAPKKITVAKVESAQVQPRLVVTGTLDPDEKSELAAQTSGSVLAVRVDLGTRVKKGDVLVELDGREAALRLDSANATASSQRARLGLKGNDKFDADAVPDVKAAKDAADLAKAEYERAKALYESGAIPKAQLDQAKSAQDRSQSNYEATRNTVEQSWAGLLASQSQAGLSKKSLDDTKILAPFDGAIVEKRIAPGEFATAGRVVAVILRDDPLRLKFDVPEADAGAVAIGNDVELTVAAFGDKVFHGKIKFVGASVKTQTRTLPVEAEVPNADHTLRPGFFARATVLLGGEARAALLVPKAAVQPAGTGFRVFVREGERVTERLVVPGRLQGDLVEVTGKLSAGEEVAIEGAAELSDGAAITL